MFNRILKNKELEKILDSNCTENDYEATVSDNLRNNGYKTKYLVLKPDNYYNSLSFKDAKTPPAADCLILVKCEKDCYNLYLVELKNINSPKRFKISNIKDKFKTVIEDFMKNRFGDIFLNEEYCSFKCYFATNPYNFQRTQSEFEKKIKLRGLKLESLLSMKPLRFKNKTAIINPVLPNPLIEDC